MKNLKISKYLDTRLGFFSLLAVLFWLKNIFAYFTAFNLGIESPFQYFILLINPIATTLFLLAIALYVRRTKTFYVTIMLIYFIMSLLLFANVVYYREFTDFITINTMLGAGKVSSGLGSSALKLFDPLDAVYLIDFFVLLYALGRRKIKQDETAIKGRFAFAMSMLAVVIFSGNLFLAETDRSGLLT